MRANHLRVCLREHRLEEAVSEVEREAVDETSGPERREQANTEEGMADGGKERKTTKWEKVVDIVQLVFRDGFITEGAD